MDPRNPVDTTRSAVGQAYATVDQAVATLGQAVTTVHQALAAVGQAVTTELAAISAPTPAGLSKPPAQQPAHP